MNILPYPISVNNKVNNVVKYSFLTRKQVFAHKKSKTFVFSKILNVNNVKNKVNK